MDPRHERAIARFMELYGPVYSAWLDAQPRLPRTEWVAPGMLNDNTVIQADEPANDNHKEAA
jgi:hypothetical protein